MTFNPLTLCPPMQSGSAVIRTKWESIHQHLTRDYNLHAHSFVANDEDVGNSRAAQTAQPAGTEEMSVSSVSLALVGHLAPVLASHWSELSGTNQSRHRVRVFMEKRRGGTKNRDLIKILTIWQYFLQSLKKTITLLKQNWWDPFILLEVK